LAESERGLTLIQWEIKTTPVSAMHKQAALNAISTFIDETTIKIICVNKTPILSAKDFGD